MRRPSAPATRSSLRNNFLFVLALVAQSGRAQSCRTTEADKTAAVEALRTLYVGATVDDMAKMHSVTAPNFYAFDGGAQFSSIDDLMKVVRKYQDQGVKYVWAVTKPQVTIHCKEAWITYVNDGSVQRPNSSPAPTQWLESAILQKQGGIWKIVCFQSTYVPPSNYAQN
jgi:hypothetical protein